MTAKYEGVLFMRMGAESYDIQKISNNVLDNTRESMYTFENYPFLGK